MATDEIGTDIFFQQTPNINALAQQGVIFRNCYAYPSCSPTRSAILTGRYGFRRGIGISTDEWALRQGMCMSHCFWNPGVKRDCIGGGVFYPAA